MTDRELVAIMASVLFLNQDQIGKYDNNVQEAVRVAKAILDEVEGIK